MNRPEIEFTGFPKIPRLYRQITITEKIDGTNGGILIQLVTLPLPNDTLVRMSDGTLMTVHAASRKRWITPERDNYTFAAWVHENAETLAMDLGPGMHFGEWWGAGIQRRYGLDHKRFSLFNVRKWAEATEHFRTPNLGMVPVLYQGDYSERAIRIAADRLEREGSAAAPGFKDPEGIVVFFEGARQPFKYTFGGDGHKG